MLFIRDIVTNFFVHRKGYELPEFHEWTNKDAVSKITQLPLVKVSPELFWQIRDTDKPLPKDLARFVRACQATLFSPVKKEGQLIFLATDGVDTIAVDTDGLDFPMRRSKLSPTQSNMCIGMLKLVREVWTNASLTEDEILNIQNHYRLYAGLTRGQKEDFSALLTALTLLKPERNLSQLRYLYKEFNYDGYFACVDDDFEALYDRMEQDLKRDRLTPSAYILADLLGVHLQSKKAIKL